jgi:hypothetical protein
MAPGNHHIWLALHLAVAVAPSLGLFLKVPDAKLFGAEPAGPPPDVTLRAWLSEDVQKNAQRWFESHIAFRGVLVRTDNTLLHASIHETKAGATVKLGSNGTIFLDDDIWYASRRPQDLPPIEDLERLGALVADVQSRAAAHGKTVVVVLAPAKTSIYPEDVPAEWKRREPAPIAPDRVAYDAVTRGFIAARAEFTDGRELIAGSGSDRELLFSRTGRHWTSVGACRVIERAVAGVLASRACGFELRSPDVSESLDYDLYRLVNTWRPFDTLANVPVLTDVAPAPKRPRALFVGDSFTWELIPAVREQVRDPYFFYYNSRVYDVGGPSPREIDKVDPASPAWTRYALERDVYIIEILEAYAHAKSIRDFLTVLRDRL